MNLNTPQEIIEDIKQGKMVILMDDEDRENEGDFIMAAELVTPEAINFMATHGRGLICMPMSAEKCKRLNLPLMVEKNDAQFTTNFTVSIEAAEGLPLVFLQQIEQQQYLQQFLKKLTSTLLFNQVTFSH